MAFKEKDIEARHKDIIDVERSTTGQMAVALMHI